MTQPWYGYDVSHREELAPMHAVSDLVPFRALTVAQPFASATVDGAKPIENRFTRTAYRGPVAIHSRLTDDLTGWADPIMRAALRDSGDLPVTPCTPREYAARFPRGVVLGVVDLADVHPVQVGCCSSPWALTEYGGRPVRYHYVWENARRLARPVSATGRQGWWYLPAAVADCVRDQLGGA